MGAVVIAAGGTGGHLYPALAVAAELRALAPGTDITFAGSADRLEARVVPAAGYPFVPVRSGAWHRTRPWTIASGAVRAAAGTVGALGVLQHANARVVFSTGGWTAAPILAAAVLRRTPIVLHEPNHAAGVVTRLFAPFAARVTAAAAGAVRGATVTGIPIRREIVTADRAAARRAFGFADEAVVVLVQGGSLSAASINQAVSDALPALKGTNIAFIWLCGRAAEAEMTARVRESGIAARVFGYCDDMGPALAAADLTVARAGASTLAEIAAVGLPAILVPYPHAAGNHQRRNAEAFAAAGAAVLVPELDDDAPTLDGPWLAAMLVTMTNHPHRATMAEAARRLARPDAAAAVAREILAAMGEGAAC